MSKILVGINTLTQVDQMVYSNHCQMWFRLGRQTQHEFILHNPRRMSIDNMRNSCAKTAIENNCNYLVFIDDDVLVPFDCIQRLINTGADIAAGWTIIRGYPFKNMFFRWTDETKLNLEMYPNPVPFAILDVAAVGFSCALIKVDLLKKVEPPYFITGPFNTEDIYFCLKAKTADPECRIVVDTNIQTDHILGPETIGPGNQKTYKEYCELTYGLKETADGPVDQRLVGDTKNPSYETLMGKILRDETMVGGVTVE